MRLLGYKSVFLFKGTGEVQGHSGLIISFLALDQIRMLGEGARTEAEVDDFCRCGEEAEREQEG